MTNTNKENDPWADGLYKNTAAAQAQFNRDRARLTEEQIEYGIGKHRENGSTEDDGRVEALEGDSDEIRGWYWNV